MCEGRHGVSGVPRAHHDCRMQKKNAQDGRGHGSWPEGTDSSLWPGHVGFMWGHGEPRKGLRKGRDVIKSGFVGECLLSGTRGEVGMVA